MLFNRHSIPRFLQALRRALRSLFSNDEYTVASDCVRSIRVARCTLCPHRVGIQCSLCTCVIELKTLLASERCPDNPPRWKEETKLSTGL